VPLNPSEQKIPNGLRYHVIDVYVDELDKVDTERNAPLEKMLEPLKELGEKSLTKPMKLRVKEALEDERLQDWKSEREQDIDEGNDGE
jgi:ribosomal RNA-processing protein 1